MVVTDGRQTGSTDEFEEDWRAVLAGERSEYLIVPSPTSGKQSDLLEWIKVKEIERLLSDAGVSGGRMLEYGCGAAGVSLYFAQQGYEAHVCDLSENALKVAALNQARNFDSTHLASSSAANVFQLPYAANSFDVVMSYGLLEHFTAEALSGLLSETVRVLRPGGMFIADIVPGPERFNARTFGLAINWIASSFAHIARGKWRDLAQVRHDYFEYYFETAFDDQTWAAILAQHSLESIRIDVCRPFPTLAISGRLERQYSQMMMKMIRFHEAFDGANTWFSRRWGWMYLASGRKKASITSG